MRLPDPVPAPAEALAAIRVRNGLPDALARQLPSFGITNTIYLLGEEVVLRVPRDRPRFIQTAYHEAIAAPIAYAIGLRTPRLLAFDDARDLLPVPYTLYERAPGLALGAACDDPALAAEAWRALGRELARLHMTTERRGRAAELELDDPPDPREWAERLAREGYITATEARWLDGWLERLAPAALADVTPRLLHADTQATNIMVQPETLSFVALIDWGDARWGDPARDFIGMPPRAAPWAVQSYREACPSCALDGLEARVMWHNLALALRQLPRGPAPEQSWAERPATRLLDLLRFIHEGPATDDDAWRATFPPRARG